MADEDPLRYEQLVEDALRGVLRRALQLIADKGLPPGHALYITFLTRIPGGGAPGSAEGGAPGSAEGVVIPDHLAAAYPNEMTIVIEHEFWDLDVDETSFALTLKFNREPVRLTIPFSAVTAFVDPHVNFGLQFHAPDGQGDTAADTGPSPMPVSMDDRAPPQDPAAGEAHDDPAGEDEKGKIVALDTFRKK